MFTGLPNLARTVGYLRLSSWTLRAELIADFVTGLLTHMDAVKASSVEVRAPARVREDGAKETPELQPFNASYVIRALHEMARTGPGPDWQTEPYWTEKETFPAIDFAQSPFAYSGAGLAVVGLSPMSA